MTNKMIWASFVAIAFIVGTMVSGSMIMAEPSTTKLIRECEKEPKKDIDIKPECELLNMINNIQLIPGPQGEKGETGTFIAQSCPSGQVVNGIDSNGMITCVELSSSETLLCDPNNDGVITAEELLAFATDNGADTTLSDIQSVIHDAEIQATSFPNGVIDTQGEFNSLNGLFELQNLQVCDGL